MAQNQEDNNWLKHALDQTRWRDQQQAGSLALVVVVIVAVVGAIYLAQASTTAAAGRRLQQLEAQHELLRQQNAQLRAELSALQSVPRLIAEAERLGYRPATSEDVDYVQIALPPPPESGEVSGRSIDEEAVSPYDETLEGWLTEQLAGFREQTGTFFDNTFGRDNVPSQDEEPDESGGEEEIP